MSPQKRKTKLKAARVAGAQNSASGHLPSTSVSVEPKRFSFWLPMKHWLQGIVLVLAALGVLYGGYSIRFSGRVYPGVRLGSLMVGGMTQEQVRQLLRSYTETIQATGIRVLIDTHIDVIRARDVGFALDPEQTAAQAMGVGRSGHLMFRFFERISAPFTFPQVVVISPLIDRAALKEEVDGIVDRIDTPRLDVRFVIEGTAVRLLTDTHPGRIAPREEIFQELLNRISRLEIPLLTVATRPDLPQADLASAQAAYEAVTRMIAEPLTLTTPSTPIVIAPSEIGVWITPGYESRRLVPVLEIQMIREYVAALANSLNTAAQDIRVVVREGKVVDFLPPKQGKTLQENETVTLITGALEDRRLGTRATQIITLPFVVSESIIDQTASDLGIRERIGIATTPFTGSPMNRIANIKNGITFLSGVLIPPGATFSTLATLGRIDNTTGYLPELVIKGDRTIPEFGGGLCQVSTTLFRAVLAAGLPIVERQNHSYRVSYYEKDENGKTIGPGLDATIYDTSPDLKFFNDTGSTILIQGSVEGTLATFELYGTRDGRVAAVDGPKTLSSSPAGEPIIIETDTLREGEKKQIERAHPGGSAIATYTVTYPDGTIKEQVFKSYYRPWPEKYLVGKKKEIANATSTPAVFPGFQSSL